MGHVLCSGAELKHGKNLREGINGQPEPQHLLRAAQPGSQFIQLEVRKVEVAEAVLVQGLCMSPCASQPRGDGGLSVALRHARQPKDPALRPARDPHHCDLVRRGFQTVQGRVASSTERGATGRASKGLDLLGMPMLAISHQSVDVSVCDPGVRTLPVRTGETLSVYAFGGSPPAFDLARERRRQTTNRNLNTSRVILILAV
jgi:hypothetical protein